ALVHHLPAGPPDLAKEDLPEHLAQFAARVEQHLAARPAEVVHTHYWLSGVAALAAARRHRIPLVATMHTTARVKNLSTAPGDRPEPPVREEGEERLVAAADALVANTDQEARELVELYAADPGRVRVVHPG